MQADRKRSNEGVHETDEQEHRQKKSLPDHREPGIGHDDVARKPR